MHAADELTRQLLAWVAEKPRTYEEAMEAWGTSCPRLPIWENAISDGLAQLSRATGSSTSLVTLTARGRALLVNAKSPT